MTQLGNGLSEEGRHEEALSVQEAELSLLRRLGVSEEFILTVQTNISNTHARMGRCEQALQMDRDIYCGRVKFNGEEDEKTLRAASNYATSLRTQRLFEECKSLLRKTAPVARRVFGEGHDVTLRMRKVYAAALCADPAATFNDLREGVTTFEDTERTARRVLGGAHPLTVEIESNLRNARAVLRAREDSV